MCFFVKNVIYAVSTRVNSCQPMGQLLYAAAQHKEDATPRHGSGARTTSRLGVLRCALSPRAARARCNYLEHSHGFQAQSFRFVTLFFTLFASRFHELFYVSYYFDIFDRLNHFLTRFYKYTVFYVTLSRP